MSDLDSWFKAREEESFFENLSETGLQTMKDYLYGNITPADAAIKYTANINIQDPTDKTMYIHLAYLVIPGYQVPGLYVQGQVVKLLAAIRDLRYKSWVASQSIHLEKRSAPELVLIELYGILSEEYDSLLSMSREQNAESSSEWININVFSARLTALNVVDSSHQVDKLCTLFLEEGIVQELPVFFDLAVSATAQHLIHSASHVYHMCETSRSFGLLEDWQTWKDGLKNSLLVTKDPQVKKYAQLAVAGMQLAEWKWKKSHRQKQGILALQNVDQTQLDGNTLEQEFDRQELQRGKKRGFFEAFSQSHTGETLAVPQVVAF